MCKLPGNPDISRWRRYRRPGRPPCPTIDGVESAGIGLPTFLGQNQPLSIRPAKEPLLRTFASAGFLPRQALICGLGRQSPSHQKSLFIIPIDGMLRFPSPIPFAKGSDRTWALGFGDVFRAACPSFVAMVTIISTKPGSGPSHRKISLENTIKFIGKV